MNHHSISRRLLQSALLGSLLIPAALGQTFAPELVLSDSSQGARALEAADIDIDGDMDLFSVEVTGQRVVWYEQLSENVFSPAKVIATGMNGAMFASVGDADGNGTPDVVVSARFANTVALYLNQNNGVSWITIPLAADAKGASSLTMTDFDIDGDMDVAVALELKNDVWSFENLSSGVFGAEHSVAAGFSGAYALAAGDFDLDGLPDLAVGGWASQELATLRNLGGLNFASKNVFATGVAGIACLRTYDFNGDGDLDILSAARNDDQVAWYRNDGAGQMGAKKVIGIHWDPYWAAGGDIDGDGDVDVAVAVDGASQVAWHRNLGAGKFGSPQVVSDTALWSRYVSLADMDADGDLDLLGSSSGDDTVSLYSNILQLNNPKLVGVTGLYSLDAGNVTITGDNLLAASVAVDGVPVPIVSATKKKLTISLQAEIPGGLRDVLLTNSFGSELTLDVLPRYPVLTGPAKVGLGKPVHLEINNGDLGAYVLAVSGALFPTPAPFAALGWYHGLELNGVWIVASGFFFLGGQDKTVTIPGVSDPSLLGVPFYFQAWTSQTIHGSAGFTAVHVVVPE